MSATEETPAGVVARALSEIATIASQRYRDECLRITGTRTVPEFSLRVEQSLNRFLGQGDDKFRRNGHLAGWYYPNPYASSQEPLSQNINVPEHRQVDVDGFSSPTENTSDTSSAFSSQNEENGDCWSSDDEASDLTSDCGIKETPPSEPDGLCFSPEPTRFTSGFSEDDVSDEQQTMPALLRRFSSSVKFELSQHTDLQGDNSNVWREGLDGSCFSPVSGSSPSTPVAVSEELFDGSCFSPGSDSPPPTPVAVSDKLTEAFDDDDEHCFTPEPNMSPPTVYSPDFSPTEVEEHEEFSD
ncbi:hypothetical protein Q1695_010353 [Nippostrongylus brasiliensis]|nr:hypothetical protein Q1695_010353 [Nippostrongylus brasiliensis]